MNVNELDLNLLVALDALLQERSVTGAGRKIGLSQPAMSRALGRLRHVFEDNLLVRAPGREFQLTPLAIELQEPVREILLLVERTVQRRPMFNPATDERVFRIAASDSSTVLILQGLLEKLSVEAPHVSLSIRPLDGRVTVNQIEVGDLDLGIWNERVSTPLLCQETLFKDRIVYAGWAGCPDFGERLTVEQCHEMPRLDYERGAHDMTGLARKEERDEIKGQSVQVALDSAVLKLFLLRGTRLITPIYERLGRRLADVAEIRLLEPPTAATVGGEAMFWHPRQSSDTAHLWMRQKLIEVGASL